MVNSEPELSNHVDDAEYREIDESDSSANHVTSEPISMSQKRVNLNKI